MLSPWIGLQLLEPVPAESSGHGNMKPCSFAKQKVSGWQIIRIYSLETVVVQQRHIQKGRIHIQVQSL